MKLSKGFIFGFSAAVTWAVLIVITRFILKEGENAYNLTFWIAVFALPCWIFLFFRKSFKEFKKITLIEYKILIGMMLVTVVGVAFTEMLALKYSQAVNYSFLIRSTILFTIVFAYFFLGEKITTKKIILAFCILVGAYLLISRGRVIKFSLGDIFTLFEAALIGLGNNVFGKIATNKMSPNLSASASSILGFIPILIITFSVGALGLPKMPLLIFISAMLAVSIELLRFNALKFSSATYTTMMFSFTPVIVAFISYFVLHEILEPIQFFGGGLIFIAGIMAEKLKI